MAVKKFLKTVLRLLRTCRLLASLHRGTKFFRAREEIMTLHFATSGN